jgi:hypothetical protein
VLSGAGSELCPRFFCYDQRHFFRRTFCFAFLPLGGGGTFTVRFISSSKLNGREILTGFAVGI